MNFRKKYLYFGIFLTILLGIYYPNNKVFANDITINNIFNKNIYNTLNKTNNNYKFSFLHSKRILNEDLNNDSESELKIFKIDNVYSYFKVWINNTGDHYIDATISKDPINGIPLGLFGIEPHSSSSFYVPLPLFYDNDSFLNNLTDIYVSIVSEPGYKLSGSIVVRKSTNEEELFNN